MVYNDFSLEKLKQQFGLLVQEERTPVVSASPVALSELLRRTLAESVPIALDISTEKARSEFAPVLMEVRRQLDYRISLFSGVEFNVDVDQGLRGVCDFLLSLSPAAGSHAAPARGLVLRLATL